MSIWGPDTTTMGMAGAMPLPDQKLHFLPLLQPKKKYKPPLERLPKGDHITNRVAFTIIDDNDKSSTDWVSTTHVFPAAFPRSHYASTAPPSAPVPRPEASRAILDRKAEQEARKADFQQWDEMASVYSVESLYPPASKEEADRLAQQYAETEQVQLWSCVQRIVPSKPVQNGITVVFTHANGFHKEIYEPTIQSLISKLSRDGKGSIQISEVWSLDSFNSGDAGTLNQGHLGQIVAWMDHSRDVLQFIDFYLPLEGAKVDSVLLQPHPQGSTRRNRKMIGVGHSFSGAAMLMLNTSIAGCFDGMIVIDPISISPASCECTRPKMEGWDAEISILLVPDFPMPKDNPMARGAIARKDVFINKRAVEDYFKTKKYFAAWDPKVIDLHARFGFRPIDGHNDNDGDDTKDSVVTLCMSKWSEALAFSTTFLGSLGNAEIKRSQFLGWGHLIITSEALNTIYAFSNPDALLADFASQFSKRSTSEVIESGHLVAQEQPETLGSRLAELIIQNESESSKARL